MLSAHPRGLMSENSLYLSRPLAPLDDCFAGPSLALGHLRSGRPTAMQFAATAALIAEVRPSTTRSHVCVALLSTIVPRHDVFDGIEHVIQSIAHACPSSLRPKLS